MSAPRKTLGAAAISVLIAVSLTAGFENDTRPTTSADVAALAAPASSDGAQQVALPAGIDRDDQSIIWTHDGQFVGCVVDVDDAACPYLCLHDTDILVAFAGSGGILAECGNASASCSSSGLVCTGAGGPTSTFVLDVGVCKLNPPPPQTVGQGICVANVPLPGEVATKWHEALVPFFHETTRLVKM